jgi:hypothetical protein
MWHDKAWARHLELVDSRQYPSQLSEMDWSIYFQGDLHSNPFVHEPETIKAIFLNHRTAQEFEQILTLDEVRHLQYANKCLCCSPVIQWPEGMKPAHYGRSCRRRSPGGYIPGALIMQSHFVYRTLATDHALRLMQWAEDHDVDTDVWNAEESIAGSPTTELGLTAWPDNWESI